VPVVYKRWKMRVVIAGLLGLLLCCCNDAWAASKRPVTGVLRYPLKYNINLEEGTIECWMKLNIEPHEFLPAKNFAGICSLVMLSGDRGGFSTSYFVGSTFGAEKAGWHVRFSPRAKMLPLGSVAMWHKNEWRHWAVTWKGRETWFYLDGKQVSYRSHPATFADTVGGLGGKALLPKWPFYFGDRWNRAANYTLDDIRVSSIARQPNELGFAVGELKVDPYTILLDSFEESFIPDGKQTTSPRVLWDGKGGVVSRINHFTDGKFGKGLSFLPPPEEVKPDANQTTAEPSDEATASESIQVGDWMRHPVLGLPLSSTLKTIDGRVETREWFDAASVDALINAEDSLVADDRTTFKFAYDATHLHFAFRLHRPSHNLRPTPGDQLAIRLDPTGQTQGAIVITMNRDGVTQVRHDGEAVKLPAMSVIAYAATDTDFGWEGELAISFADLGVTAPRPGDQWRANVSRIDATPVHNVSRWSYTGRFPPGLSHDGRIAFLGKPIAVSMRGGWLGSYRDVGVMATIANFSNEPIDVDVAGLIHRSETAQAIPMIAAVDDETTDDLGQPRGKMNDELQKALDVYKPLETLSRRQHIEPRSTRLVRILLPDDPGDYVTAMSLKVGDTQLAGLLVPARVPDHLGLAMQIHQLSEAVVFDVNLKRLADELSEDAKLTVELRDASGKQLGVKTYDKLAEQPTIQDAFHTTLAFESSYHVHASVEQGGLHLASRELAGSTVPELQLPLWWTMKPVEEPKIPPPWHPVRATAKEADVLLRTYSFDKQALPSQIVTRGRSILAGPIELTTAQPWQGQAVKLHTSDGEAATYVGTLKQDDATITITNRVEFDGFMLIDVEMAGSGTIDDLHLNIPFKTEHAQLLQNYRQAPGPSVRVGRFHGLIPDEGYSSPPFFTTWIGTDHYGLEFSCESSRGWSMAEPATAMRVTRDGSTTTLRVGFISRPIQLSPDEPRTIRFGLVATPTKTLLPHVRNARFYDDVAVLLLPYDWSGFPAWHPPMTDEKRIAEKKQWIDKYHNERRQKVLVNGGWAVSTQDPTNQPWIHEMFRAPMMNVSYSGARQFAYCWHSPYGRFIANSFAHNARLLGFDGIRFDTVTPGYTCQSVAHGCAWTDDDGNVWPRYQIFGQREVWKKIYRAFHGGVIKEGIVYTPNASGPIMAVHSFSDHHEIGEGFYQKAPNLKKGYPPDMVRAIMTGDPYGFVTASNLKMGPLFYNERIGALLVNGAEPRFLDYRHWSNHYGRHGAPAISIWEAWDWIDRYNAHWLGWWENQQLISVDSKDNEIYASLYLRDEPKRVLLIVTNYEQKPLGKLPVKLNLQKLGFTGPVFAEDAVKHMPIAVDAAGSMTLDLFPQRYRLVMISQDKPRYREQLLSDNLLTNAPESTTKSWVSGDLKLEPNSVYVLRAEVSIPEEIGRNSKNPNHMGRFSPGIRHRVQIALSGKGVWGINGSDRRHGPDDYGKSKWYARSHRPDWWSPTDGYYTMFLPVKTDETASVARFHLHLTDPGQATIRRISLQRVQTGAD